MTHVGAAMTPGEKYVATMSERASDRLARLAFCELAMRSVAPGGVIFDFGAGPGIDAMTYSERGHRVLAYDVDPLMCAAFLRYCRRSIARQNVVLFEGSYQSFLSSDPVFDNCRAIDLVTANFAPLSLVADPTKLFARFHAVTNPGARVIVSVLNPYFWGDLRYGWWWRSSLSLIRRGSYSVSGEAGPIHRRSPGVYAAAAAPYFRLNRVVRGLPSNSLSGGVLRLPLLATGRFLFLLFEKRT